MLNHKQSTETETQLSVPFFLEFLEFAVHFHLQAQHLLAQHDNNGRNYHSPRFCAKTIFKPLFSVLIFFFVLPHFSFFFQSVFFCCFHFRQWRGYELQLFLTSISSYFIQLFASVFVCAILIAGRNCSLFCSANGTNRK